MIYLGFKFVPVPNWDVIMPIKAPSNYKKPEAIAKYIAERKAELAGGKAATELLVGQITQIALVDPVEDRDEILEGDDVCDIFKDLIEATTKGISVVGYRIRRALKIMALLNAIHADALGKENIVPVAHFKWIDEMYNKLGGFIDPVSLLFGTTDIDVNAVAMRCGVKINPEDPRALAEFAMVMLRNVDLGK
jgi:hypothetical protein